MICITLNSSSILAELGYGFHMQSGLNEKEQKILIFIYCQQKNTNIHKANKEINRNNRTLGAISLPVDAVSKSSNHKSF